MSQGTFGGIFAPPLGVVICSEISFIQGRSMHLYRRHGTYLSVKNIDRKHKKHVSGCLEDGMLGRMDGGFRRLWAALFDNEPLGVEALGFWRIFSYYKKALQQSVFPFNHRTVHLCKTSQFSKWKIHWHHDLSLFLPNFLLPLPYLEKFEKKNIMKRMIKGQLQIKVNRTLRKNTNETEHVLQRFKLLVS